MNLSQKVAFNTIFQIIGKIIVTALSLITIGYLTRYLGVAGYGAYTTIFAYVSFWGVLADFGFFWVLARELSKPGSNQNYIFNNVITLKIIFGLVVFSLCAIIGLLIPQYNLTLKIGIVVIAASSFWLSLNSTYVGLFQSHLEMYKSAISEILGRVIILVGVIWLVIASASLQSILIVYILANFTNFLLSYIWGRKYIKFKLAFDFPFWKIILWESSSLALLAFIGLIHFKVDTVILSLMKGNTDVGIYGVPYKILEIVLLLPSVFIGNVFPILTRYYHSNDKRLEISFQKTFDFLVIVAIPIVIGLSVLAEPIIKFIAGNDYLSISTVVVSGYNITAPRVLMILSISVGVSFVLSIFSNMLTVIGKQRKQVIPLFFITIINIVLNLIFIPHYSYFASAIITFITETLMLVWWYILFRKYLKFKLRYNVIPKAILAGIAMGIVLYYLSSFNVLVVSIIGTFIYFFVGYAIKLFDRDMLTKILPKFNIGKSNQ